MGEGGGVKLVDDGKGIEKGWMLTRKTDWRD